MKKKNKHLRYFRNSSVFDVICALLILAGFLIYRYSWEIWMLGTPILVIGVVGFGISYLFKVNDHTYSEYFEKMLSKMPAEPETDPDYTAGEYFFEGNQFSKLDKTGAPRSEIYVCTRLYLGKTLKLISGTVNAAENTSDYSTFSFTSASASVENTEIKIGGSTKKAAVMTITDGTQICRFPVRYNDIEVDDLMNKINRKYNV